MAHANTFPTSDVRSADWSLQDEDETEQRVRADQEMQMRWHDIMRPVASMLKFRLSWKPGQTEYLDGTIYLPVWGPITTTETRLIVHDDRAKRPDDTDTAPRRMYDNARYERQLFYFNTTTRVALFPHDVVATGLDHCYDCRAEVDILTAYLASDHAGGTDRASTGTSRGADPSDVSSAAERVAEISERISSECARNRTLASKNSDPEERKKGIQSRQWIKGEPAYDYMRKRTAGERDGDDYSGGAILSQTARTMYEQMGRGGSSADDLVRARAVARATRVYTDAERRGEMVTQSATRGLGYDARHATADFMGVFGDGQRRPAADAWTKRERERDRGQEPERDRDRDRERAREWQRMPERKRGRDWELGPGREDGRGWEREPSGESDRKPVPDEQRKHGDMIAADDLRNMLAKRPRTTGSDA
jgi:hypothetical protein